MDYDDDDEMAGYISSVDQREKEEMEFYTDLAVQEMQRWIENNPAVLMDGRHSGHESIVVMDALTISWCVTRKKFKFSDDPKNSLSDGVLLCELLNSISPGTVKRINRLPTPMAGMDNLNVFIDASKRHFGLKEAQLFAPADLQDFAERNRSDVVLSPELQKESEDRKLRNVAITIFWLARQVQGEFFGPDLDFTNFTALVNAKSLNSSHGSNTLGSTGPFSHQHQYSTGSSDWTESGDHYKHSRTSSRDSYGEEMRRSSEHSGVYVGGGHSGGYGARREGRSYSSSDSLDDLELITSPVRNQEKPKKTSGKSRTDRPGSHNSGSSLRRTSTAQPAYDPLQFIALKPAANLAKKAEKQIEIVQETKKKRQSVDKDEAEWQFNLSDWKTRRKSKSGSVLPEREANEVQSEKYIEYEREHRDKEPGHSKSAHSSQSYEEDEAFYSPGYHQKSSSEDASSRDESETPGSIREFQPLNDGPLEDIIQRATIIPVQSKPLQSASLRTTTEPPTAESSASLRATTEPSASLRSTTGSITHSMVKSKMRVKLETEPGHDDGFGFTIKGGKDKCLPITIESIVNDSAADQAELLEGDEVLEINDEVVTERNRGYCMLLINGSLQKNGTLNMFIKRDPAKIPVIAKERKQTTTVAPKSILDLYDNLESSVDTEDTQDGGMISHENKEMDKLDEEFTRREMEREYRQILDGGYDSAVSTLRSEITAEDRQSYLESHPHIDIQGQEKITPVIVHAAYTSPSSEYVSAPEYNTNSRAESTSEESNREQTNSTRDLESDEEGRMHAVEQNYEKVSKDFESVAPSLAQNDIRLQSRSKQMDVDNRRRMEEWQKQQDQRQQERYMKEQQELQRQVEKSRLEAEESERNRKNLSEASSPIPPHEEEKSDFMSSAPPLSLRQSLSNAAKEKETRDRAVQRLLDIKARYSQDQLQSDNNNQSDKQSSSHASYSHHEEESGDSDDELSQYRIRESDNPASRGKDNSDEMRDRYTSNYYDYKPVETNQPKETPYLSDVYKYYDEDVPSNLGERDPTPPPMTRKDVVNMNKKSTPWQDAKDLPQDSDRPWERREVIAPVSNSTAAAPVTRRNHPNTVPDNRRKSAPAQPRWNSQDYEEAPVMRQSSTDRQTDVDPNLPSTLRKEDVLKMTREKARFSQPRRASEAPVKSQPINLKKMNAVPIARRKSNLDWLKNQSDDDSVQNEADESDSKPKRNPKGFFSNRAMFEQQSRQADQYWAEQAERKQSLPKHKPAPLRKAVSTTQAPNLSKQGRSKSVDIRPSLNRGDVVKGQDVSDAAYERMKELAMMKQLREAESEKAEQDEQERRNRERKLRDERQRELAEIRKMNQQYEQQNQADDDDDDREQYRQPANRDDELNAARKRMAREAEELARAQMRHDQDIKAVHGVDMQAERRQREMSRPMNGRAEDEEDNRHSRELSSLDSDERSDMARRRHQELIEQSRRDQQRREEAGRIKQQQSERPDSRRSDQQRPQRQQQHTQQQQDDEWRPEQQPRTSVPQQQQQQNYNSRQANNYSNQRAPPQQQAKQQHNRQPQYSDTKQQNNEPIYGYRMASPPETRQPTHSQPSVTSGSPVDNYARYEDNFNAPQNVPNGYERRQSPGPRSSQSMPRQSENLYNNGGYQAPADKEQSYGAPPSENRKSINPQTQSTQRSTPPLYNNKAQNYADRTSAPKPYERQQPLGHSLNPRNRDSYDTRDNSIAAAGRPQAGNVGLYNNHPRQDSYDRNVHSGYSSSSNEGYNEPRPGYSAEQPARIPNYNQTPPATSSHKLPHEDPRYGGNKFATPQPNNNNDISNKDKYNSRSPEPETQSSDAPPPSKPARVPNHKPRAEDDETITVSAKYMCAYCTKELGKGAAMVIESLGLYYHVECFRCCVCHSLLSNGQMGADVRVRGNRLHCKNCYSNDDGMVYY